MADIELIETVTGSHDPYSATVSFAAPADMQLGDVLTVVITHNSPDLAAATFTDGTFGNWKMVLEYPYVSGADAAPGGVLFSLVVDADALEAGSFDFVADNPIQAAGGLLQQYRNALRYGPYGGPVWNAAFGAPSSEAQNETDAVTAAGVAAPYTGARVVTVALGTELGTWTQGALVDDGSTPTAPPPTGGTEEGSTSATVASLPEYAVGTGVSSSTTTLTKAWPVAHATDDIGLLWVQTSNETVTLSDPQGFTAVDAVGSGATGAANSAGMALFWCRATSGSMPSPTIADAGDHVTAGLYCVRGCITSGDPIDVYASAAGSGTAVTIPGATTTGPSRLVVVGVAHGIDNASAQFSAWANADLSDVTEHSDAGTTTFNGGGIGFISGGKVAAGAFGDTTATLASSTNWAGLAVALIPDDSAGVNVSMQMVGENVTISGDPTLTEYRRAIHNDTVQDIQALVYVLAPDLCDCTDEVDLVELPADDAGAAVGDYVGVGDSEAPRDLYVDPDTHDLVTSTDIHVVSGTNAVGQAIQIKLYALLGEWFLDEEIGFPYFTQVMVKAPNLIAIRELYRQHIDTVPGVNEVLNIDVLFDPDARSLSVAFTVDTDLGEFSATFNSQNVGA